MIPIAWLVVGIISAAGSYAGQKIADNSDKKESASVKQSPIVDGALSKSSEDLSNKHLIVGAVAAGVALAYISRKRV